MDIKRTALDNGYMKHVGWEQTTQNDQNYRILFTPEYLLLIQSKITDLLQGVDEDNRPIVVTLPVISNVLSSVYETNRPEVGSIYSRYIQEYPESNRNDIRDIADRAINIIVSSIKNEMITIEQNKRLSIWATQYGDFNKEGLRAHAPVKIRKRGPTRGLINMNY